MTHEGEWGLGDLAYGGCGRMLVGRNHPTSANQRAFTRYDAYWNDLIAHYRSRVERVIYHVVLGTILPWTLCPTCAIHGGYCFDNCT